MSTPAEQLATLFGDLSRALSAQHELGGTLLRKVTRADWMRETRSQESVQTPDAPVQVAKKATTTTPAPQSTEQPRLTLSEISDELGNCERCRLCAGRKNIVFGVGNSNADLMFIGEAPGADEDRLGEPFVGKAGQLLTKMIQAICLQRSDVYIANVIKCRPPRNRDPESDEISACEPFLIKQIDAIQPKVVVTLGRVSASALLKRQVRITRERGRWVTYHQVPLMPTFHPAYLLRNPSAKREAWADLKAVMARLGLAPRARE